MTLLSRRLFLRSLCTAPAVVLSTSIMPISAAKLFLPAPLSDVEVFADLLKRRMNDAYREMAQHMTNNLYGDNTPRRIGFSPYLTLPHGKP